MALRPPFPSRQAQFVQVFSAETCTILQALRWSQHQQFCHFSSLALFSLPSFLLWWKFSQKRSFLFSPLLSGYNGFSVTHFYEVIIRLTNWLDEVRCSSHLHSYVFSLLLFVSTLLFSWTAAVRTVSSKFFNTQARAVLYKFFDKQLPSVCLWLCSLVTLVVSSLAATSTVFC